MTNYTNDKYDEAIKIMGEEMIEKLYRILGSERFSIAMLRRIILKRKVSEAAVKKSSVTKMANDNDVCRMTIYRARNGKEPSKS